MKEKIKEIIISSKLGGMSLIEATQKILDLFAINGSLCEYCKDDKKAICCQTCLDDIINQTENRQ